MYLCNLWEEKAFLVVNQLYNPMSELQFMAFFEVWELIAAQLLVFCEGVGQLLNTCLIDWI